MTSVTAGAQYDRTFVRWGQGSEMSAFEAAMWHISRRSSLRASSVVVELLDNTPDFERLVAGHAWALGRVPRLRQRVVTDPARLGPPAWADTDVDLGYHVRRVRLGAGGELADVLEIAAELHEAPFASDRPLWVGMLVEGLPDGQSAYLLAFHHAMADDLALVALFELLHSSVRHPTVSGPKRLPPPIRESCTPAELAARHALRGVARTPQTVAGLGRDALRAGLASVRDPAGSVGRSALTVRTTARSLTSIGWSGSPLLQRRGAQRGLVAIHLPVAQLRAAGAATGGRVADVALAATIDGVLRYHRELGTPVGELPVAVPLRVRLDGSGDRLPRARIMVPAGEESLEQRITLMSRLVAEAETRPHVDLLRAAAPVLSRVPAAVSGRLLERANRSLALQGFVVSGLNRDAFLAGGRVGQMFSFASTAGCALSMTLLSHQDTSCLAFNLDRAAVSDPELMSECLHEAFDSLPE